MIAFVQRFAADERGATAMEYGLIVALIGLAVLGATTALGTNLKARFTTLANDVKK